MNLSLSLSLGSPVMMGGLRPPPGFLFLIDTDGAYLTDADGAFLLEAI